MYKPYINKVLVEIDDQDAEWGKSSDGNIGGEVYREGKIIEGGLLIETPDYIASLEEVNEEISKLIGKRIIWNEGHEAGTVFEENGKKYALIYWWDIIGVKDDK
jgi:co-chaperonin GroES (HSP10)